MVFQATFPVVRYFNRDPLHCIRFLVDVIAEHEVSCFLETAFSGAFHVQLKSSIGVCKCCQIRCLPGVLDVTLFRLHDVICYILQKGHRNLTQTACLPEHEQQGIVIIDPRLALLRKLVQSGAFSAFLPPSEPAQFHMQVGETPSDKDVDSLELFLANHKCSLYPHDGVVLWSPICLAFSFPEEVLHQTIYFPN